MTSRFSSQETRAAAVQAAATMVAGLELELGDRFRMSDLAETIVELAETIDAWVAAGGDMSETLAERLGGMPQHPAQWD